MQCMQICQMCWEQMMMSFILCHINVLCRHVCKIFFYILKSTEVLLGKPIHQRNTVHKLYKCVILDTRQQSSSVFELPFIMQFYAYQSHKEFNLIFSDLSLWRGSKGGLGCEEVIFHWSSCVHTASHLSLKNLFFL